MQEVMLPLRLRENPQIRLFWKKDITEPFIKEMEQRDSIVLWVYGGTGTGKSSFTLELSRIKDPGMSAERVAFDNSQLQQVIRASKEGQGIIRDETVKDYGEGSDQMLSMVQDASETLRKRRNSFYLLSPIIKGVPFVHFYIEILQSSINLERESIKTAIGTGLKHIMFRAGVYDPDMTPLGFIVLKTRINNPLYTDYEVKKDQFIQLMSSGERTSGLDIGAEAKKFLSIIDVEEYSKKSERHNFIKMNSNYTISQVKSIHIELERLLARNPNMQTQKKPEINKNLNKKRIYF